MHGNCCVLAFISCLLVRTAFIFSALGGVHARILKPDQHNKYKPFTLIEAEKYGIVAVVILNKCWVMGQNWDMMCLGIITTYKTKTYCYQSVLIFF